MYRFKYFATTALFWALTIQPATTQAVWGQDTIPRTPVGKRLADLIDAVNESDSEKRTAYLKNGFEKNDEAAVKERQMQTKMVREQMGQFTFKKVVSTEDDRISALFSTTNGQDVILSINVTDEAPHKITRVALEVTDGESDDESPADATLDAATKARVIEQLATELRTKYVFPKIGEEMALAVEKSVEDGDYTEFEDAREFATYLTEQLRDICNDKHLRVRSGTPRRPSRGPGRRQSDNHGFVKVEMLPGGIGYLKFNYFSSDDDAKKTATAAMNFLANSKAIIFDLRQNGGGSPDMIAYLSSYLFEEPTHLNSFYNRPSDTTTESWTQKEVPGKKMVDTPVYVLTSNYTFSGAEEFSYNLRNLKRGTIVGETTGGGAHPVRPVSLGSRFHMSMPFARAINPITQTNWEGVGVKPHVETSADDALEKALELARSAETEVAKKSDAAEKTETSQIDAGAMMQKADSLMADQSFAEAAKAFAKVVEVQPKNGMAWFRYGYCLHANGDLDEAIKIHKKAASFEQLAGISTYNLACAYSLKKESDKAFKTLHRAVELGFNDVGQLEGDSDFDNIRNDERFEKLIKQLEDNQ